MEQEIDPNVMLTQQHDYKIEARRLSQCSTHGLLENLLESARKQKLRQIKRMQQLKNQSELFQQKQQEYSEKLHREQLREIQKEADRQDKKTKMRTQRQRAEMRRLAVVDAARKHQERERKLLSKRLQAAEQRAQEAVEGRALQTRTEIHEKNLRAQVKWEANIQSRQLSEQQRRKLFQIKMDNAEKQVQRLQEIRSHEEFIKKMAEKRKEMHRQTVFQKMQEEQRTTIKQFKKRQKAKDRMLMRKQEAAEQDRLQKIEMAAIKAEIHKMKIQEADIADKNHRDRLRDRINGKMQRAEQLQEEREILLQEISKIRSELNQHEQLLKESLDKLYMTGKMKLPRSLQMLLDSDINLESTYSSTYRPSSATLLFETHKSRSEGEAEEGGLRTETSWRNTQSQKKVGKWMRGDLSTRELRLKQALEEEQSKEMERRSIFNEIKDPKERLRMQKHFESERARAREHISQLMEEG